MAAPPAHGLLDINTAPDSSDLNALAQEFYDFDEKIFKKKIKNILLFKKKKSKHTHIHKKKTLLFRRKYLFM